MSKKAHPLFVLLKKTIHFYLKNTFFEQGDARPELSRVNQRCAEILLYNYSDTSCAAR